MKRVYAVFLCLLYAGIFMLSAQTVSNTEKRRMNMAVLQILEKYETLSECRTAAQANEFVNLFRSPMSNVYNDLAGVSDLQEISVKEYVSLLRGLRGVDVTVRNVRKSRPYVSAGSLCIDVTLEKTMSYYDRRDVWYSSEDVYGVPYELILVISYDDFDGTCYIESVAGSIDGKEPLGTDHLVLRKPSADILEGLMYKDADAVAKGKYWSVESCSPVAFGDSGVAFMPSSVADEDWYYMQDIPGTMDPDRFLRTSVTDDGFLTITPKMKNFRARVYNSLSIAGSFDIGGDLDKAVSFTNETGVDLRYMFNLGKRLNLGIYGGLGVAYDYLDVAVQDFGYSYQFSKKERKYDIALLGQKYSLLDGVLSGGVAIEVALSRRAVMNVDLGGKAYVNLMAKTGNIDADYKVTYADSTFHLRGHFRAETIVNKVDLKPDVWPCPVSAVAGLGFSINMTKAALFNFGIKYEHGLNYYYYSEMKPYKEYETPVKCSYLDGRDLIQYDFADSFSLKKKALWLDLGLVFKF